MKKTVCFIISALLFFSFQSVYALEVSKSELESAGSGDTIVFRNYTGPHAVINTADEIRGIGSALGQRVAASPDASGQTGSSMMYSVIHAVDPSVTQGLDADIIVIGSYAGVDHIDNLRMIIASYLHAAYGYSDADAATLATFVTVYNAVYRGNLASYQAKYKQAVTGYLTAEAAGLSTNYEDWPGRSQIVIPLSDPGAVGAAAVDTSVISDKRVIESMKEEDGRGIDERKNMVDIKEREADTAAVNAQEAQKNAVAAAAAADEAQQKAAEEQQQLAQAQAEAQQAQAAADEAAKVAEENPDDPEAQQAAEEAAAVAEEKQQEASQQEAVAAEQEQRAAEARQTAAEESQRAAEQQAAADKKRAEAQDERKEIAKDQNEIIAETAAAPVRTEVGLRMVNAAELLSALVQFDPATGKTVRESPVNVIRGRTVVPAGTTYAAIAGKTGGNGNAAIKLVLLDRQSMEIIGESAEIAAPQSVLVSDGTMLYAVVQSGSAWVVGKYDSNLKLVAQSAIPVLPETPIVLNGATACVTASDNTVKILNTSDMSVLNK